MIVVRLFDLEKLHYKHSVLTFSITVCKTYFEIMFSNLKNSKFLITQINEGLKI
jgi:hypothetical protein